MKAKTFLVAFCGFIILVSWLVFGENPTANQSKSAPKPWLYGLYDRLFTPASKPAATDGTHPQAVPGKSIVIYYGDHPEVVSLNATNHAGLVGPFTPTK